MTCPQEKWISAFMDGELTLKKAKRLKDHLQSCRDCREMVSILTQQDLQLKTLPEIEPSEQFERTFWKKTAAWEERKQRRPFLEWFRQGWRPVLAVGFALLILVFSVTFNRRFGATPTPEEIMMAEKMDVLEQYEIITNLELLENWETITSEDGNS